MELEKVPLIDKEEVLKNLDSEDYVILNVLAHHAYEKIHIKNSKSVPFDKLEAGDHEEFDKNKRIVTYCASYSCSASKRAAALLMDKGFNVLAYEGGIKEWAESDYPTEGEMTPSEYVRSLQK